MQVVIARTMPEFSMDVYARGLISGLRAVRPQWEIIEMSPEQIDRKDRSIWIRVWKYYERFINFPHRVISQKADVVHILDAAEAHIVYGLRNTSKRTVVTCHDLINFYYKDNLISSVQLPFVSHNMWLRAIRGMKFADHVIAVSNSTAKDTMRILNIHPERISVAPDAVEGDFQRLPSVEIQAIRERYGIRPDTLCLLTVGSDHPRKNLPNIIEALGLLKQKEFDFEFWKAGSDFTSEQKALIEKLGVGDRIRYLGKPDQKTLIEIYNAADVLIFTSLFEGFGMPILEAMACGTPVITSNVSAMPEVVEDDGLLVDPRSPAEIAEAVFTLHQNLELRHALIDQGLVKIKSFTWENTAEKIARVYEKILEESLIK